MISLYFDIRHELAYEFHEDADTLGLKYDKIYGDAYAEALTGMHIDANDKEKLKEAIRGVLSDMLMTYANSKATTKGGLIGRFFARIGAAVVKVVKFDFLNKKK